jgi:hypothetical protein
MTYGKLELTEGDVKRSPERAPPGCWRREDGLTSLGIVSTDAGREPRRPVARGLSAVAVVVLVAAATMVAATAVRAACLRSLLDGTRDEGWCGTQITDLLGTEDLTGGRLPYLDACDRAEPTTPCDEYPVLTMYAMRLAGVTGTEPFRYFLASAALLTLAAVLIAWQLGRLVGVRALYFSAAPTLLLYGLMNWDLVGVALLVWGIAEFVRGRDGRAGVAVGLAAATKLFPALFLAGMVAERVREGRASRATRLVAAAGAAWLAVDLPFAILAPERWAFFFRFNSSRPPDVDSLWYAACRRGFGEVPCMPTGLVNALSLALFAGIAILVWRSAVRRGAATWTLGFPLLAVFFLANKVYSPQYDLWLLPWFALALPHAGLFAIFTAGEVAVFLTRYADLAAPPSAVFHAAVLLRDAALAACVVAAARGWTLDRPAAPLGLARAVGR